MEFQFYFFVNKLYYIRISFGYLTLYKMMFISSLHICLSFFRQQMCANDYTSLDPDNPSGLCSLRIINHFIPSPFLILLIICYVVVLNLILSVLHYDCYTSTIKSFCRNWLLVLIFLKNVVIVPVSFKATQ